MKKTVLKSTLSSAELIRHLAKKLKAATDAELAALLDIKPAALSHWRKETTILSPLQLANVLAKAHHAARDHVHRNAIKPIVEFFPINAVPAGRLEKRLEVIPTKQSASKHLKGLHAALLDAKAGLYIFYDTRGRALYAGQTKSQNIWKEMNAAFNRDRSAQVMTLVRHPENAVEFKPAHEKVRQPTDRTLKLHDLAAYFSAYEVIPEMVDDLEALLVRAFPNDLLNFKMEKFGKTTRKTVKDASMRAAKRRALSV